MSARRPTPTPPSPPGIEPSSYHEILENALAATGTRLVGMLRRDGGSDEVQIMALAGLDRGAMARALAAARQQFPELDANQLNLRPQPARWHDTVFRSGRPVHGTFAELAAGALDDRLIEASATVGGLRHVYAVPVRSSREVTAALVFHHSRPLSDALHRVCDAFAREAALTMENNRLLEELRSQVEELQRSRRMITAAEERQRREIAELLHGRVQTYLLVAWHRLGQCEELVSSDPTAARALIAEVRDQIDHIREHEVRQASHLLHPSIIRIGLAPAVRSLAGRFESDFQIDVETDQALVEIDDPAENRIPEDLRLAIYRILEEALSNIYRHAGATHVAISLSASQDQMIHLRVADDGRGFNPTRLRPGLGLNSIGDRVSQLGGTWALSGAVGHGATLTVSLPLIEQT